MEAIFLETVTLLFTISTVNKHSLFCEVLHLGHVLTLNLTLLVFVYWVTLRRLKKILTYWCFLTSM